MVTTTARPRALPRTESEETSLDSVDTGIIEVVIDPGVARAATLLQRAQTLPKPRIGYTLKLTTFLADHLMATATKYRSVGERPDDRQMVLSLIGELDEPTLLEFAKILLCVEDEPVVELTTDDLDLELITEAFARWCEMINIPAIIKNVRRVASNVR